MGVALLLVLLLLAGCQTTTGPAITERAVTWSMQHDPTASWQARGNTGQVNGYAVWTKDWCTIVTRPPAGPDDSKTCSTVYHELRHCQDGQWH